VLLYFKGLSLRAVRKFLLHIREWFHVVGRALQAVYTIAIWVYVDETKIKARDRTYYLWLAVDEKGLPVFVHLSRRRDAWTAGSRTIYYNTKNAVLQAKNYQGRTAFVQRRARGCKGRKHIRKVGWEGFNNQNG
jgi:transposase-like protein